MSLQNLSCNAAFLILHTKGIALPDLATFKKHCKFKMSLGYEKENYLEKSKENVKDWTKEECERNIKMLLEELELTESDLIRK